MVSFCLSALMIYNTSEKKNQKQHPRMAAAWTMDGGSPITPIPLQLENDNNSKGVENLINLEIEAEKCTLIADGIER